MVQRSLFCPLHKMLRSTKYVIQHSLLRLRIETTRYIAGITNTQTIDYGLKQQGTLQELQTHKIQTAD